MMLKILLVAWVIWCVYCGIEMISDGYGLLATAWGEAIWLLVGYIGWREFSRR